MTDNGTYRELVASLLDDLHGEAWCWECGFRKGHREGCRIARLLDLTAREPGGIYPFGYIAPDDELGQKMIEAWNRGMSDA